MQRSLANAGADTGNVLAAQGNFKDALASYQTALTVMKELVAKRPDSAPLQYNLTYLPVKVGDTEIGQKNLPDALAAYRGAVAIMEKLTNLDTNNKLWQRDLSICYGKIGDVDITLAIGKKRPRRTTGKSASRNNSPIPMSAI